MTDQHQQPNASTKYWLCVVLGIALTASSGIVYGRLSHRWGPVPDLIAAAQHLQTFPTHLGDWELFAEKPIAESAIRELDCAGHVHRDYVNGKTGQTISMFVIVGPPGPTAVHTPEICYSSRAYGVQTARRRVTLTNTNQNSSTFWSVRLRSNRVMAGQTLSVYYAWNGGKGWKASDSPRFEYGGRPMLYKIQLATLVTDTSKNETVSPCHGFLTELLKSKAIASSQPADFAVSAKRMDIIVKTEFFVDSRMSLCYDLQTNLPRIKKINCLFG